MAETSDPRDCETAPIPARRSFLTRSLVATIAAWLGTSALNGFASHRAHAEGVAADSVPPKPKVAFHYIGLCVADIERSTRFYQRVFGFEASDTHNIGAPLAHLLEVTGELSVLARMIHLGDVKVELIQYVTPKAGGKPARRGNVFGLSHLAFHVDDVQRVAALIRENGGTVLDSTLTHTGTPTTPGADLMFCLDPDGSRVELITG